MKKYLLSCFLIVILLLTNTACTITANNHTDAVYTRLEITTLPDKVEYQFGETLDLTGLVVSTIHEKFSNDKFTDATKSVVTDYQTSIAEGAIVDANYVEVSYTLNDLTHTATFDLVIDPLVLEANRLSTYLNDAITFEIEQIDDIGNVEITWNPESFDRVEALDLTIYNGDYADFSVSADFSDGVANVRAYYGYNDLVVTAHFKDDFDLRSFRYTALKDFVVKADVYNIAPLNGTFPVLLFSLSSFRFEGETFVYLEREATYEKTALPEGINLMPNRIMLAGDFHVRKGALKIWINELYASNPECFINLYVCDVYSEFMFVFFAENQIPSENFQVTLMTDGSGTEAIYIENFGRHENGDEIFAEQAAMLQALYAESFATGTDLLGSGYQRLEQYSLTFATFDNVVIWVQDIANLFTYTEDAALITTLTALIEADKIIETKVASLLEQVIDDGDLEAFELWMKLKWQDINGTMQQVSDLFNTGKTPLIILGTRTESEDANFGAARADYLAAIQAQFPDHTVFYKGHPGTPTVINSDKHHEFDTLGIVELPASIPAELFGYLYDVTLGGYPGSTYASLDAGQTLVVIGPLSFQTDDFQTQFIAATGQYAGVQFVYSVGGVITFNTTGIFE